MLQITPAERLALQSLAEGRTISQVAALLELREQDMDDLLVALFARMCVRTPLEAVAAAMRRGGSMVFHQPRERGRHCVTFDVAGVKSSTGSLRERD